MNFRTWATTICNRFTLRARLNRILQEMDVQGGPEWSPWYNIAPTQSVPIVRYNHDGKREGTLVRRGLVPTWATNLKKLPPVFNARSETIASKPSFRTAFKKGRCLIPVDGWYEWNAIGKIEQPYFMRMADDSPFAFADSGNFGMATTSRSKVARSSLQGQWCCRHPSMISVR